MRPTPPWLPSLLLALVFVSATGAQAQVTRAEGLVPLTRAASLIGQATPARGCERFANAGTTGTFVLFDTGSGAILACNPERARERFLPASTFKIPNALNALESGLLADEHVTMRWDGVDRGMPAWNRDSDLERGMRDSVVWFYQALARGTGQAAMQAHVDKLDYGNRDIGGGLDRFWLDGSLRISAAEQVVFLDALRRRALPLSKRSQDIVARILERERGDRDPGACDAPGPDRRSCGEWVWRGKTGLAIPLAANTADLDLQAKAGVGWLVGWVERPEGDVVYAMNLVADGTQPVALRAQLTRALLVDNGVLPHAK